MRTDALRPALRTVRTRRRHAWCETPSCRWGVASTMANPTGRRDDPVFASAIEHCSESGHAVTVEKITTVRYLKPEESS